MSSTLGEATTVRATLLHIRSDGYLGAFKENVTVLASFVDGVLLSMTFDADSAEDKWFLSTWKENPGAFRRVRRSYSSAGKKVSYSFYIERRYLGLLGDYRG